MRVLFNRITFEVMRERKDDAPFDTSQKPANVPTSTPKQIKMLSLLASLKNQEGFKDILEELADHLYFSIFGKSKLYVKSMFQACSLVRFFLLLLRIGGLEERCRLFIYDALFFKSVRNHVFMLTAIEVWPEVLKWTGLAQNEIILDPILEAMVWMIYNTGLGGSEITLKVFEARNALRNVCRLPNPECSATDMIKKFLRIGLQSKDKPHLLDSLNRAILLVSRSQDYQWNHNNLIRPLLELVGKSCQEDDDESQTVLCWAIEAIGLTSRCYPAEARKHLEHIFEALAKLLDSHKLNARGEGICLLALLRVGHHLQLQVAKFLVKWKPRNVIGLDVFEVVSNFLGTRAKKFTTKTIEISRYSENRSKKKRLNSSL
ncbi:uncharacterized protein LOC131881425 [Tigriopus californicus]|nr:uncharacterized protein LOC131881425 [Tigriopus californicus]